MSQIRTSLSIPTQPWETAKLRFFANLSPQEISLYENASLENLFYDASSIQRKHARGSRIWRLQERMTPLIDSIEDYGKAMDVFVNTCPLIMSPLWGSIRVVLLVSEAASFQEKLVDCLAQIGDVLPRFRVYEVIFRNHERLLVALSAAYLDVLNFCVATKDFFVKNRRSVIPLSIALRGLWSSHLRVFDDYKSKFRAHSKRVTSEAGIAHYIESAKNREVQLRDKALQIRNAKLERRNQALISLPAVDYMSKQNRLTGIRHPGTCIWLQNMPEFDSWFKSPKSACVCCYGIPGAGKSVLAASLRDFLKGRLLADNNEIICYYYFDYSDHASLISSHIVASLVKQVLEGLPLDHFDDSFTSPYSRAQQLPDLAESTHYLASILKTFGTTYLILDGIDELVPEEQTNCLKLIEMLMRQSEIKVKIFVTSRTEEFRVKKALQNHGVLYMSRERVDSDIARYIKDEIGRMDAPPLSNDKALRNEAVCRLVEGSQGMFLWAHFQLIEIEACLTKEAVQTTLANLPKTLNETYLRILHKILNSPGGQAKLDLMRKAFEWISVARRPLRLEELEEAVALEPTDTFLHMDRIPKGIGGRLLGACGNLALLDEEENTVTFAHHTVKQFFSSMHWSTDELSPFVSLKSSEETVGHLCLVYLSFSDFETQVAQAPKQAQIDYDLVGEVLWLNVPFAARFRDAISWSRSWRGIPDQDLSSVDFVIPVTSAPTGVLMRQYILLEYIIEYWIYHTSGMRKSSTSSSTWSTLEHVVLHRQLFFEYRPWNDHSHRKRVKTELQNLHDCGSKITKARLVVMLNSSGAILQITIYAWALRHAVGSLLGLLDRSIMDAYLNLVRLETVPAGLESGWVSSEHVYSVFNNFPPPVSRELKILDLQHHTESKWSGELLNQLLCISTDSHGSLDTELLYIFLGHELRRWLDCGIWTDLQISTAIHALRRGNRASFDCVFQDCVGDSSQFATSTSASWQTCASAKIVKGCLTRPATGTAWTCNIEWDLVFMLERHYATYNLPLWISELMGAQTTDEYIGRALIVVALVHRKSMSYVTTIMTNLGITVDQKSTFRPPGDWKKSRFGSKDAYQRIAPFLWVDVFALVPEINNATRRYNTPLNRYGPREQHLAWAVAVQPVIKLWYKHNKCFSVESLEKDGIHILKWVVYHRAFDTVEALMPMYKEYGRTEDGRAEIAEILDFNAPEATLQLIKSLRLHEAQAATPAVPKVT
ncbi:hypothetical protein E8E13_003624 [Curvularia kusanoi]|uniref:NACHT domain-containing protein n=1 Tax=Curvularia kusanoi TaxID=90978 RepID=A0A9P4T6K3_CURKU|nr:hypothetical protein E8E13_003624 [Curvularia kusanoi]